MKAKFLHYKKDDKNYTEPFGMSRNIREEFGGGHGGEGHGGEGHGGHGGGGMGHSGGHGGGMGHSGGHGWGRAGHGRGYYGNSGVGYGGYGWGGPYPYYSTYVVDNACTQLNKDPYSTGNEIRCCDNLVPCYRDWDNNEKPYYLCRDAC